MSDLRVSLEGSSGSYFWSIGFDGDRPLMQSKCYRKRSEMKAALVLVLQCIQKDDFTCYDYTNHNEPPKEQSEVVSIIKLPTRRPTWQVTSKHGWGIVLADDACPCKRGEVMALFEDNVVVGKLSFAIVAHEKVPGSCSVYKVKPGKPVEAAPEPEEKPAPKKGKRK